MMGHRSFLLVFMKKIVMFLLNLPFKGEDAAAAASLYNDVGVINRKRRRLAGQSKTIDVILINRNWNPSSNRLQYRQSSSQTFLQLKCFELLPSYSKNLVLPSPLWEEGIVEGIK